MKITTIHIEYAGRLSNGNYGSEEWRIGFGADVEEDESPDDATAELAQLARGTAEQLLLKSRFRAVRAAIDQVEPDPPDDSPF